MLCGRRLIGEHVLLLVVLCLWLRDGIVSLQWDLETRVELDVGEVGEGGGGCSTARGCEGVLIGVWSCVGAGFRGNKDLVL